MRFNHFKFILRIGAISLASASAMSCSDDAENTTTSGGPGDACGPGAVLCGATCTSTELDPNNSRWSPTSRPARSSRRPAG